MNRHATEGMHIHDLVFDKMTMARSHEKLA